MSEPVITIHQPSMTEWFAAIGEATEAEAFRDEDNQKVQRLEQLRRLINFPYREPTVVPARQVWDKAPAFKKVLQERGSERCAFRLVPLDAGLPKLRHRGQTVEDCYNQWFLKLTIDLDKYKVEIFPDEAQILWSSIFVVKPEAIFGELIRGKPNQLSQGETLSEAYQFRYDFQTLELSEETPGLAHEVNRVLEAVKVTDPGKRAKLKQELGASFYHGYIIGYFETVVPPDGELYFIDYNRILPEHISDPGPLTTKDAGPELRGAVGYPGYVRGRAVVVTDETIDTVEFREGDVLVCDRTDVRYLPLMRKAGAIVTQRGGILSHASIIARELKKPCIVGIHGLMEVIRPGMQLTVNANQGSVTTQEN